MIGIPEFFCIYFNTFKHVKLAFVIQNEKKTIKEIISLTVDPFIRPSLKKMVLIVLSSGFPQTIFKIAESFKIITEEVGTSAAHAQP